MWPRNRLNYLPEIAVTLIGFIFSYFLFFNTFLEKDNKLFIASKAWSDFASHIPLIRSFSLGSNLPPEYPLFPGEPIKYHFLFYYLVGLLEKIGFNVGFALNSLSALGFILLLFAIYLLSKEIFKSKSIGLLSVILFIFNSSLSFLYFFKKYPISINTPNQIIKNADFLSFAPYGDGIISAFWNLNILTNQRHLSISFALSLFIIYLVLAPVFNKKAHSKFAHILLGIILGLSFFLHTAVYLMTSLVLIGFLIYFSKLRKNLFILLSFAGIIFLPQYLFLNSSPGFSPNFELGYLISGNFSLEKFIEFWSFNLGLSIITIPLGILFANKPQRKIFLSFFILFMIGNLIQFSPEIAANHKFFNFFIIIGNMFSAFILVKVWKRKNLLKPFAVIIFLFLIFGGIIDLFPIINDRKYELNDYKNDPDASWILDNTEKNSIFLNSTYLYNPASLAGRKIYFGWPYFAWSQGYDTYYRGELFKKMLGTTSKPEACNLLKENKIDYVEIKDQSPPDPNIPPISKIYKTEFNPSYENTLNNYRIYNVIKNCL